MSPTCPAPGLSTGGIGVEAPACGAALHPHTETLDLGAFALRCSCGYQGRSPRGLRQHVNNKRDELICESWMSHRIDRQRVAGGM